MALEIDLYPPVKAFLEDEGFEVKAEVNGCDVVANKPNAPTVIVELKVVFSLDLVLQGIERQKMVDDVYLAVLKPDTPGKQKNWRKRQRSLITLCKKLGLGLFVVDPAHARPVEVLLDPAPYQPRKNRRQETRLKKEFMARAGDPNTGGATKTKIVTVYRQDALRCAAAMVNGQPMPLKILRDTTGVARAAAILQANHYGWFEREGRGVYKLTAHGQEALAHYAEVVKQLD